MLCAYTTISVPYGRCMCEWLACSSLVVAKYILRFIVAHILYRHNTNDGFNAAICFSFYFFVVFHIEYACI